MHFRLLLHFPFNQVKNEYYSIWICKPNDARMLCAAWIFRQLVLIGRMSTEIIVTIQRCCFVVVHFSFQGKMANWFVCVCFFFFSPSLSLSLCFFLFTLWILHFHYSVLLFVLLICSLFFLRFAPLHFCPRKFNVYSEIYIFFFIFIFVYFCSRLQVCFYSLHEI